MIGLVYSVEDVLVSFDSFSTRIEREGLDGFLLAKYVSRNKLDLASTPDHPVLIKSTLQRTLNNGPQNGPTLA
jgi:hypothetical protein